MNYMKSYTIILAAFLLASASMHAMEKQAKTSHLGFKSGGMATQPNQPTNQSANQTIVLDTGAKACLCCILCPCLTYYAITDRFGWTEEARKLEKGRKEFQEILKKYNQAQKME